MVLAKLILAASYFYDSSSPLRSHNVAANPIDPSSWSSSAAPIMRYKNGRGVLSYAQDNVADFRTLADVFSGTQWKIYEFVFKSGLEFCQKAQSSQCTVSYLPGGYSELGFNKELGGKLEMFFVTTRTPQCTFCGDVDKAKDFPLANLFPTFLQVKVEFNWEDFKPKVRNPKECHELLSTTVTQPPESNEAVSLALPKATVNAPALPSAVSLPAPAPSNALSSAPAPTLASAKPTRQEIDVQVAKLKKKRAAERKEAKERTREDGEQEIRAVEAMLRQLKAKLAADLRNIEDEGKRVGEEIEDALRGLQG